MIGDDHQTAPMQCPGCAANLDGHMEASLGNPRPTPGAVSLCSYCSTISLYVSVNGQLRLRRPTDAELDDLLRDPNIQRGIAVIRAVRERQR